MRKIIFALLSLYSVGMSAQSTTDDYYSPSKPKLLSADRVSASMSMGAGVSFLNKSSNAAFSTYIAPKISYALTPKFSLNVALLHYTLSGNTFMGINRNEAMYNVSANTITGNLIALGGEYQINKRFILSGAVMTDASNIMNKQNNFKAVTMGLEYKVSKHASIYMQTTISQGQNNHYYNPNDFNSFNNYPMYGIGQDAAKLMNGFIH